MKSCLYTGFIQHRRHAPRSNEFRYRIYMTLLDLDELPTLFDRFWLWSVRRPALAWFRRKDFHGPASKPLSESVRDTVEQHTGKRPSGPIRLLTHLRYFGYSFNPVSFYYVYDAADAQVETIVAEITNTPWKQRHCYVLDTDTDSTLWPLPPQAGEGWDGGINIGTDSRPHPNPPPSNGGGNATWQWQFDKDFHVSPFMPMDMRYHWRFSAPDDALHVHMENWRDGEKAFDATLNLQRQAITSASLARALISVPLVTLQVITLIHWQALKLLLKRVPIHTHPDKLANRTLESSGQS
ncbi:MAG: DUF1365 domain-containing protein [Steroidobacteraceae bacterium]